MKRCCGNCVRFVRDPENPGHGWCDDWAVAPLEESCVCHPFIGCIKKNEKEIYEKGGS